MWAGMRVLISATGQCLQIYSLCRTGRGWHYDTLKKKISSALTVKGSLVKPSLSTGTANLSSALKEGLCFKETAQHPLYKCGDKIQIVIMTRLTKHHTVCMYM
jgi:hypothetical protein